MYLPEIFSFWQQHGNKIGLCGHLLHKVTQNEFSCCPLFDAIEFLNDNGPIIIKFLRYHFILNTKRYQ